MPLTLRDVQRDPIAKRALEQLTHRYTIAEENTGLVLTERTSDMKLFLSDLDDLHQWDFVHNQKILAKNEELSAFSRNVYEQVESWKYRALVAEATLLELIGDKCARQNVSDFRYAALKRYLAKQFHPDHAPGNGIEKIVRNEIFKEIWTEVDRLDDKAVPATSSATARSSPTT